MKKIKMKLLLATTVSILAVVTFNINGVYAATSPTLAGSISYSILGAETVTNTGSTTTTGDVGVAAGTAITGFPPGIAGGDNAAHIHSNDASAIAAQADSLVAFGNLDQPCDSSYADGQDLTLLSPLVPGVYCSAGSFLLTGNLTLSGSGVYIFKTVSSLIASSGSSVTTTDPCNVWWRIGTSATFDTTSSFAGNILALTSISFNTGATLNGRALVQTGAVTMDANIITTPSCVAPVVAPEEVAPEEVAPVVAPVIVTPKLPNTGYAPIETSKLFWLVGVSASGIIAACTLLIARKRRAL